jgi:carboxymethylenebutenolidase
MTTRIDLESTAGERIQGELKEPPGVGKAPGLIVVQEWWGVNDHIRSLVDRFAAAGFLALAPDLYKGKTTKDVGEASKLMNALDWGKAVEDVGGAARLLAKHPRCNGKVGITGFCMGGAVALAAGARIPELRAVVPFYGMPDPATDYTKMTAAVLGHYGEKDTYYDPGKVRALEKRLRDAGKRADLQIYAAGHAFVNDTRPEAYDAAAANLAWDQTLTFLHAELG